MTKSFYRGYLTKSSCDVENARWSDAVVTLMPLAAAQGIYHAAETDPENKYVLKVKAMGVRGALGLKAGTPDDVASWTKFTGNNFHGGGIYNIIEMVEDTEQGEEAWEAHRRDKHITSGNCPTRLGLLSC